MSSLLVMPTRCSPARTAPICRGSTISSMSPRRPALTAIASERALDIRFETSDTERARGFIREQAFYPISTVEGEPNQYRIDLRAAP